MSNEAAERLRSDMTWEDEGDALRFDLRLDEALAAAKDEGDKAGYAEGYRHGERFGRSQERRATVERMRPFFERLADYFDTNGDTATGDALRATWRKAHDAILDEEAAHDVRTGQGEQDDITGHIEVRSNEHGLSWAVLQQAAINLRMSLHIPETGPLMGWDALAKEYDRLNGDKSDDPFYPTGERW
jgi:hypothetical protein